MTSDSQQTQTRETTRIVIFVILFGVTGFLGLPLLWFSKSFTPWEKVFWSVMTTLYTLLLIAIAAATCWWAYRQLYPA